MKINLLLPLIAAGIFMVGCGQNSADKRTKFEDSHYISLGDSIATHAQKILLTNVSTAIQNRGVAGAVGYCNERAIPLTDSVSDLHQVKIQRLSDKNRNPMNALREQADREAWTTLQEIMKDESMLEKFLLKENNGKMVFYKPIMLGRNTCLSCHGEIGEDIATSTYDIISSKYQEDKATGYKMGAFRGMWKVQFD